MINNKRRQVNLEDILITPQLARRLPKSPDFQAESQAMHTLVRQLAKSPQTILKTLVSIAKDLCTAGTAGVSLLETNENGEEIFRWVALAGELEQYEGGETPGDFSPCRVCLERQEPTLYLYPEQYFTYFQHAKPAIVEVLVIPLVIDEQQKGTIWIVSHDQKQQFDSEDVRIMTSLGEFSAVALQSSQARTKAQEAKLALQESQAQVQSLITNMPGMVYRYVPCADGKDRFTFVSSGCRDLFEVEPAAALQNAGSIWNLIHPDDKASFSVSVETAVKNFLPWDWQGRVITPSGELKWVQGRSNALHSEQGDIWDGLLIDITESKQAAEALQESEGLKNSILESSTDCIKVLSLNYEILYISTGGLCLLEIDKLESILNADWSSFWHEDHEKALSALASARMGNTAQFQGYLPTTSGKPKWWDTIITPVRDASGHVVQLVAISRDITEIKRIENAREQAEIALREAHIQLESALLAGAVYTWRWNILTNRVIVNTAFAHLFGVDPVLAGTEGLPIELFLNAMHPQDRSRVWEAIEQAMHTGQPYSSEYRVNTASGEERWVSARGQVEYDAFGKAVSLPGALIDITERKLIEASREQILHREQAAREAAETANRIKDEFLAVLSHELRSPLNPILGWSKLLRSGKLDADKAAHGLETIERNAKLQVQLIEDLLDVERILRGKLSLKTDKVDLVSTITAAIETVQLAAQAKSIRVETVFETEGQILGDAARLQQIIWNLVSNAVKFTPANGSVRITLNRVGEQAQIQVSDNGKGISKEFLPHVFDYFRQADSTTTRTFGGLGLGLAIVRHLVELHGGSVRAYSPGVGLGATFTVKLPLLKPENSKNLEASTSLSLVSNSLFPLANVRILLVDDETDTRDLIAFILEQSGAIVTSKTGAIQALQAFKPSKFDVLVSDIGMPQMDGYTLIQNIQAMASEQNTKVLAVALTAYAGEINQQQALTAGFHKHIAKPVEPEHLVKVITDLVESV